MELYHILLDRQEAYRKKNNLTEQIINHDIFSIGVVIGNFIDEDVMQLNILTTQTYKD
jgi:hypothetical protein